MLPGKCDRQPWKASDLAAMARDEIAPGMVLGEKWHGLEELIEQKIRRQSRTEGPPSGDCEVVALPA